MSDQRALYTAAPIRFLAWRLIINIAVLASGSGTNLQAILDSQEPGVEPSLVVSDRPGAKALDRARSVGIPTAVVDWDQFEDRNAFCADLAAVLSSVPVDGLVLAGFMRILNADFVGRYPNRILNVHPSLLPAFPGAHAVEQALQHGVRVTGVTVHFVDERVDHGPIIAQRAVPVLDDDDVDTLHDRIQIEEHDLYPKVVGAFARDEIEIQGRRVIWQ
jgi:phosphoribosylglycinamide formyltransferase 1